MLRYLTTVSPIEHLAFVHTLLLLFGCNDCCSTTRLAHAKMLCSVRSLSFSLSLVSLLYLNFFIYDINRKKAKLHTSRSLAALSINLLSDGWLLPGNNRAQSSGGELGRKRCFAPVDFRTRGRVHSNSICLMLNAEWERDTQIISFPLALSRV